MSVKQELDKLDLQILSVLVEDAKVPYAKIGELLYVSAGTVHLRIKKMEQIGVIKNYRIVINHELLGYGVTAFIGIYLQTSSLYDEVAHQLKQISEVVGLNYTTGGYSMFLKIICTDTNHLKQVLHDKIQVIHGIQRTETFISLDENINRPIQLIEGH